MTQVLFFGASSTQGVGDSEGGWADRLKRDLHRHMYGESGTGEAHSVFNLGVLGNSAELVARRMSVEVEARKWLTWPFVFVICVGTNDSRADKESTNKRYSTEDYQQNLEKLLGIARIYSNRILLVGLTPTDDTKTQPKNNVYFWQSRVREFDQAMTATAQKLDITKVEIFEGFMNHDWKSLVAEDGLHPNTAGHALIADLVRPHLLPFLDSKI